MKLPRYVILLFIVLLALSALILYYFHPLHYSFYPRCPFLGLTGYTCPFCGGLRATHELTHGNLKAAFQFNALLVLMIPIILMRLLVEMPWFSTKNSILTRLLSFFTIKALTVIVLMWWIVRNMVGV